MTSILFEPKMTSYVLEHRLQHQSGQGIPCYWYHVTQYNLPHGDADTALRSNELPRWGHRPGWSHLQSSVRDQGEPPSWRISAVVWFGEGWAPPNDIVQESPHGMSAKKNTIPDQSSPGSPRTAPPAVHQGRVGEKWITGVPKKITRARNNITIGTWNVRTLKDLGKLKELQYEMKRYD